MEEIKELSIKDIAGADQHISKHEKSSIKRVYTEKLSKSDSKNARLILSEKKANYKKDIENKEANEFDINRNSQRVERHKTKKEDLDGVRLDINDLSDSNNSLFKFEDEKSEYIKSQTFRQNKDLGQIPNEFKQKIYELKKTAMIYDENERCYSPLPYLGENCSGCNVKNPELRINYGALLDSFILSIFLYIISIIIGSLISDSIGVILGFIISFLIYLIVNFEFFSDGFSIIDTTTPVSNYRCVETIHCSANIIYEELVGGQNIDRYDIMMKGQPYIIHEDKQAHLKFKRVCFDLPEYIYYKPLCTSRVCYLKQYHGIDDDGVCFILTKKAKSLPELHSNDVEIKEFEESIIIVPVSGAESRVILISNFDYGGKIPTFIKSMISTERLKYLTCIKSLFYDMNQAKIYETLKKAIEIVKEINKASCKNISEINSTKKIKKNEKEEAKRMYNDDFSPLKFIPGEDSANADNDLDNESDIQSLNESYHDLNSIKVKSNPFAVDKETRNTISVRPSYEKKRLQDHYKSNQIKEEPKIIYEEVEDDV